MVNKFWQEKKKVCFKILLFGILVSALMFVILSCGLVCGSVVTTATTSAPQLIERETRRRMAEEDR